MRVLDLKTDTVFSNISNSTSKATTLQILDEPFISIAIDQYLGSIKIYSIDPDIASNYLYLTYNVSIIYKNFYYSPSKNRMIFTKNNGFMVYDIYCLNSQQLSYIEGLCIKCKQTCLTCNISGNCLTCKTSFQLNSSFDCVAI